MSYATLEKETPVLKRNVFAFLAGAALIGCNSVDESDPANPVTPSAEAPATNSVAGTKVYEEKVSATAGFSVYKQGDRYLMLADAHLDKDKGIVPVVREALRKSSVVEAYQALQALKVVPTEVPAELIQIDGEISSSRLSRETAPRRGKRVSEVEEGGDAPDLGPVKALAKSAAEEPEWDWIGDAEWFEGLVRAQHSNEYEAFRTNKTYWTLSKEGYDHYAAGMAASFNGNGRLRGWYETCFFDCWWEDSFDWTIQSRYVKFASYLGNKYSQFIKVRADGYGPTPRVHLGLMWDDNSSANPTPNADISVSITSFSNNALKWTVKNSGSANLTDPWVKLVWKSGTGNTTTEFQVPSLTPGQTWSESRYAGDAITSVTITVDSKNQITESSELNNTATKSHTP